MYTLEDDKNIYSVSYQIVFVISPVSMFSLLHDSKVFEGTSTSTPVTFTQWNTILVYFQKPKNTMNFFFFFFNKNSVLLKVFKGGVSVFSFWSSDDWTARIEQPSALLSNLAFKKTHPGDCPAIRLMV